MVMGMEEIDSTPTRLNDADTKWDKDWGITITQPGNMAMLREAMIIGKVVAVSDGSFQDTSRSAAWTIKGIMSVHQIVGKGQMPWTAKDHSANCSKLFGLWGMLRTIQNFIADQQILTGQITIACDRLSPLCQAKSNRPANPAAAHYDMIGAIWQLRPQIPIKVTFVHVKGHQDTRSITALPRLVWMNIEIDGLAKDTIDMEKQGPARYQLGKEQWVCHIEGKRLIKELTTSLHKHINQRAIEEHWAQKQRYKRGIAKMVDHKMAG